MRSLILSLTLLTAPAVAQTGPPNVLSDSIRHALQIEVHALKDSDQLARTMFEYGTFSPCVADSLQRSLDGLSVEEDISQSEALRAAAQARTGPTERAVLLRRMNDTDAAIQERLMEIIVEHGWPSDDRTGADASPVVFLLHAPNRMAEWRDVLLAEVAAGRLPAREFAMAHDKADRVYGRRPLYGTGREYDAETQTIVPPRIVDIAVTNAARAAIGMPPLTEYRIAE